MQAFWVIFFKKTDNGGDRSEVCTVCWEEDLGSFFQPKKSQNLWCKTAFCIADRDLK